MLGSKSLRLTFAISLLAVGCGDDVSSAGTDGGTTGEDPSSSSSTAPTTTDPSSTTDPSTSSSGDPTLADSSSSSTGEPPPEPLEWQSDCVVGGFNLQELGQELECTGIEVPLDWNDPEGQQLTAAALRVRTDAEQRRGTFWILDGGPGGAGLSYLSDDGLLEEITAAGWDVIIPPHRGTFSPNLSCGPQPPSSAGCRETLEKEWGDGLQHFNTRWAAHDVAALIEREQAPEEQVVVYGLSYGTYWAQFYAGDFPTQADAIILDSTVPTTGDLAQEEYLVQDAAERMLQLCADDVDCAAQTGFDSGEALAAAAIDALDNGECGGGDTALWENSNFRLVFGQLVNIQTTRNYFPLLVAMLTRCDPDLTAIVNNSVQSLLNLAAADASHTEQFPLGGTPAPFDIAFSGPLQAAVIATTMIADDASGSQAELDARRHIASLNFGALQAAVTEGWGSLPRIDFDRDFTSETPMLVFNATFDLQTTFVWAEQVAEQHNAQLVEFHDARHGVALSGTGGKFPGGESCARSMMLAFAEDPAAKLDTSCADELPRVDVTLQREDLQSINMEVFGVEDPWTLLPPLE